MSDDQPESPAEPTAEPTEPTPVTESDRIARLRARQVASDDAPPPRFADPAPPAPASPPAPPVAAAPTPAAPTPAPAAVEPAVDPQTPYDVPPGAGEPRSRGRWSGDSPRLAIAVATAVLAATATALAGLVTTHVSSVNADESTRSEVVGVATSGVATVLSYDYRHLDSDFAAAERLLSPKFRKQYDDTTAKGVKPLAAKYKAISSADVSAAGVVEADADRAVVLVFVNQTVTNSQLTAPRLDRSRIDVTLVRSNGHWLIDKLTTL